MCRNTETIATVARADLTRLQTLNETVKKEQELSSTRLKVCTASLLVELTNPPGHLWRDKWTALSGPLSRPRISVLFSLGAPIW